jgi:hypothetical protein
MGAAEDARSDHTSVRFRTLICGIKRGGGSRNLSKLMASTARILD